MSEELDRLKRMEDRLDLYIETFEQCIADPGIESDDLRKTCVFAWKSKLKLLNEIKGGQA